MADERTILRAVELRRRGMLTPGVVQTMRTEGTPRYEAFLASKAAKILRRPWRPNVRWIRDYS